MKRLLLPVFLLAALASCRPHQAVTASDPSAYTPQPPSPPATTNTTTSTTTTTPPPANTGTTTVTSTTTSTTTTVTGSGSETTTVNGGTGNGTTVVTTVAADTTQQLYRVTVTFISRGEGIDYKTQEVFENWLKEYPKHPAYQKTHWGREGETGYCLKLDELSTREQEIFVRDLRTLLADKQLILIQEYATCKGRPE